MVAVLKRAKAWLSLYIPLCDLSHLRLPTVDTDLKIAIMVWKHNNVGTTALSFYNNHLDKRAMFSSFAVDRSSTSRDNPWVVGEKGKGFILAMHMPLPADMKSGVSFRVGHQIGTTKWKKARYDGDDDPLRVVLDDLTPRIVDQYLDKARYGELGRALPDIALISRLLLSFSGRYKMRKAAESALRGVYKRRVTQQLDSKAAHEVLNNDGCSLVFDDEVAVTICGIDGSLSPEHLFSAIYSIILPPRAWLKSSTTKFYHRDQYVPYGLHLNRLSINNHGDLDITADRVAILRNGRVMRYQFAISDTVNEAFINHPELAVELAIDILTDSHSEGLVQLVSPTDKDHGDAYKLAFDTALRQLHPHIAKNAPIHPWRPGGSWNLPVRMSPLTSTRAESFGAPPLPNFRGLDRLRVALSVLAPDVLQENVTIRDYDKSSPAVVWDKNSAAFAFALPPKCEEHSQSPCLCWVGPVLHAAAQDYNGATLGTKKLFRAYLLCMKGDASMRDDDAGSAGDEDGMDVDSLIGNVNASSQKSSDDDDDGNDVDYVESGADDSIMSQWLHLLDIHAKALGLPPHLSPFEDFLESHLTQQSASPTPAPAPVPTPQATWRQCIPAPVGTGDPVASVMAVLRHNQDLQDALDDADTIINARQSEINLCNTAREALRRSSNRADELSRLCGVKEAKIAALKGELANARGQVEQIQEILGCRPSSGEASSGSPSKRARLN
ncbi:hypothetical protein C8J57DRAFT_1509598 [Mycena rebaudengoi]|nr:hypothetical protein C8J57DRAFT_1509598 [Mycena rebaudengoi]